MPNSGKPGTAGRPNERNRGEPAHEPQQGPSKSPGRERRSPRNHGRAHHRTRRAERRMTAYGNPRCECPTGPGTAWAGPAIALCHHSTAAEAASVREKAPRHHGRLPPEHHGRPSPRTSTRTPCPARPSPDWPRITGGRPRETPTGRRTGTNTSVININFMRSLSLAAEMIMCTMIIQRNERRGRGPGRMNAGPRTETARFPARRRPSRGTPGAHPEKRSRERRGGRMARAFSEIPCPGVLEEKIHQGSWRPWPPCSCSPEAVAGMPLAVPSLNILAEPGKGLVSAGAERHGAHRKGLDTGRAPNGAGHRRRHPAGGRRKALQGQGNQKGAGPTSAEARRARIPKGRWENGRTSGRSPIPEDKAARRRRLHIPKERSAPVQGGRRQRGNGQKQPPT